MWLINAYSLSRSVVIALLGLTLATLLACSGDSEPASQKMPAVTAQTPVAATVGAATTNKAATAPETGAIAPEQLTETDNATDNGVESISDTSATTVTTPVLKLASSATPEPKAAPSIFKEGVHYKRLVPTQPTNGAPGQIEIAEIFWYGCPHCFALDPKIEIWREKNKPSFVTFLRIPGAINDAALFHGRIFYTAELLGKLEELHTLIFREIHLNGDPLNTMDKAKAFFTAHGVTKADFDKTFASFALESKLQNATMLMRRYRVTGVPSFVVNGKFTTDVASAGGEEQLFQLLNELAIREHVN